MRRYNNFNKRQRIKRKVYLEREILDLQNAIERIEINKLDVEL